ncbi:hypothetical protein [Loigolactobacillus iwatensis]|uniref:hypothetical protein n=1 Tax=Loigolactobacillus iwatensis TaxID=1267156 RepID=UPI000F7E978A|nr:hypothetical protein [Loigolactobacillus iwatensis]
MDTSEPTPTYTPSNFRKYQSKLLKQVAQSNRPIRVTIPNKNSGPNQDLFVISATDFAEFQKLKDDFYSQIDNEIGAIADKISHKKTSDPRIVADWLNED